MKLHRAGVETKMVLYKGLGHACIDNTGVYPQCGDCIDEMVSFILAHCNYTEVPKNNRQSPLTCCGTFAVQVRGLSC